MSPDVDPGARHIGRPIAGCVCYLMSLIHVFFEMSIPELTMLVHGSHCYIAARLGLRPQGDISLLDKTHQRLRMES